LHSRKSRGTTYSLTNEKNCHAKTYFLINWKRSNHGGQETAYPPLEIFVQEEKK
jgi:hypothetical protein